MLYRLNNTSFAANFIFGGSGEMRNGFKLKDGTIIGTAIYPNDCSSADDICAELAVDVNGEKEPNTYGKDIFIFGVTKTKLVPYGYPDIEKSGNPCSHTNRWSCNFNYGCVGENAEGYGCAGWVIYNENLDYLHCDDLSWTGKTKCK